MVITTHIHYIFFKWYKFIHSWAILKFGLDLHGYEFLPMHIWVCVEMFISGLWGTDGYQENAKFHSFHTINFWKGDVFILVPGGKHQRIAPQKYIFLMCIYLTCIFAKCTPSKAISSKVYFCKMYLTCVSSKPCEFIFFFGIAPFNFNQMRCLITD